jgi:hypothetical protein
MTVEELIRMLSRFPGKAEVVFGPRECCGGGYPEWLDAHTRYDDETGRVYLELTVENPECEPYCEHGVPDGDYCDECNAAYKAAAADPDNLAGSA